MERLLTSFSGVYGAWSEFGLLCRWEDGFGFLLILGALASYGGFIT